MQLEVHRVGKIGKRGEIDLLWRLGRIYDLVWLDAWLAIWYGSFPFLS